MRATGAYASRPRNASGFAEESGRASCAVATLPRRAPRAHPEADWNLIGLTRKSATRVKHGVARPRTLTS